MSAAEPGVGAVVVDAQGSAWVHLVTGWADVGAPPDDMGEPVTTTWALIVEHCGPLRVVREGAS